MSAKAARTQAEQQIEALRQLKQTQARRKPTPPPTAPKPAPSPASAEAPSFELSEQPVKAAKKSGPSLPLSLAQWRRLRERQRESAEFRRRRDMGDWAAELLLALPAGASKLSPAGKEELLRKLREWGEARGLR